MVQVAVATVAMINTCRNLGCTGWRCHPHAFVNNCFATNGEYRWEVGGGSQIGSIIQNGEMSLYTDEFLSFMRLPKTCLTIASVEGKHSRSQRLTFLHESPPKGTHQPITIFTHHQIFTKKYGYKKMALKSIDPLLSNNRLHPATSVQCPRKEYAGKYASQYMPGSKGDKSEPKEANVVVFAAAEDDNGGSLGRFPWGFMAGLEKGKWYQVISI